MTLYFNTNIVQLVERIGISSRYSSVVITSPHQITCTLFERGCNVSTSNHLHPIRAWLERIHITSPHAIRAWLVYYLTFYRSLHMISQNYIIITHYSPHRVSTYIISSSSRVILTTKYLAINPARQQNFLQRETSASMSFSICFLNLI